MRKLLSKQLCAKADGLHLFNFLFSAIPETSRWFMKILIPRLDGSSRRLRASPRRPRNVTLEIFNCEACHGVISSPSCDRAAVIVIPVAYNTHMVYAGPRKERAGERALVNRFPYKAYLSLSFSLFFFLCVRNTPPQSRWATSKRRMQRETFSCKVRACIWIFFF